jgi:cytidylate kinase
MPGPAPSAPPFLPVVAIDGPSGAGKSTVARRLAERLGYAFLDTGAMYRAVTWLFLVAGILPAEVTPETRQAMEALVNNLQLDLRTGGQVLVNGHDVTHHLRSREVDARVSMVSALKFVRAQMTRLQRQISGRGPLVAEGRDMTTVVFPDAAWKFYLDADVAERARRRAAEFTSRGQVITEAEVLDEIRVRDHLDTTRADAPLRRSPDAVVIDTTGLPVDAVVDRMVESMNRRGPAPVPGARQGAGA